MSKRVHNVVPALAKLLAPIDSVEPHPDNPNEGDVGALCQQLEARGQHRPIVVQQGSRRIIAGEHTWRAAGQLGWTHLALIEVEDDDLQALARMVGDNLPGRRSRDDDAGLAKVLTALAEGGSLEGSGYTGDDLDDVMARLDAAGPAGLPDADRMDALSRNVPEGMVRLVIDVAPNVHESWMAMVAASGGRSEAEVFADLVADAFMAALG